MRMAGDMVDGCIPSKLVQEDMEVGQVGGEVGQFNASQQDLNSQPASQPLDASFDMESPYQGLDEGVWGQLYPHIPNAGFESGCTSKSVIWRIIRSFLISVHSV